MYIQSKIQDLRIYCPLDGVLFEYQKGSWVFYNKQSVEYFFPIFVANNHKIKETQREC